MARGPGSSSARSTAVRRPTVRGSRRRGSMAAHGCPAGRWPGCCRSAGRCGPGSVPDRRPVGGEPGGQCDPLTWDGVLERALAGGLCGGSWRAAACSAGKGRGGWMASVRIRVPAAAAASASGMLASDREASRPSTSKAPRGMSAATSSTTPRPRHAARASRLAPGLARWPGQLERERPAALGDGQDDRVVAVPEPFASDGELPLASKMAGQGGQSGYPGPAVR